MTAGEAEGIAQGGGKVLDAVNQGQIDAIFVTVRRGGSRTECWIRRESLNRWIAARDAELARYMPRPEAKRVLGLRTPPSPESPPREPCATWKDLNRTFLGFFFPSRRCHEV